MIRKAEIKDLEKIRELNLELFKKEFREFDGTLDCSWPLKKEAEDYFKERINRKGIALVAEENGKIVGYFLGGESEIEQYRQNFSVAEMESMLVLEDYRGKGIGKSMVEEFMKWAEDYDIIRVKASFQNEQGINFYKKLGFKGYDVTLEKS